MEVYPLDPRIFESWEHILFIKIDCFKLSNRKYLNYKSNLKANDIRYGAYAKTRVSRSQALSTIAILLVQLCVGQMPDLLNLKACQASHIRHCDI